MGDRAKFQRLKEKIKTQPYPRTSCNDYFDLASLEKKFAKDPYGKDRANAANNERKNDYKATQGFTKDSKDAQHHEFNNNGDAKSDAQKAKERAKAGFLKFLHILPKSSTTPASYYQGSAKSWAWE